MENNLIVEIGLDALGRSLITEENLTSRTIEALRRHPENTVEVLLTSLILFGEQEADAKLLSHVFRLATAIEGKQSEREGCEVVQITRPLQKIAMSA